MKVNPNQNTSFENDDNEMEIEDRSPQQKQSTILRYLHLSHTEFGGIELFGSQGCGLNNQNSCHLI